MRDSAVRWCHGGSLCTACTRRLKTRTLLFAEGTGLVWHIDTPESRLRTKTAKYGMYLSHLETPSPWVGRLHAVQKSPSAVSDARWAILISGCRHSVQRSHPLTPATLASGELAWALACPGVPRVPRVECEQVYVSLLPLRQVFVPMPGGERA